MVLDSLSLHTVAIVTGGSSRAGRDVALVLASWAWPIVIVYLDHQARVEATVAEIIAAGGITVAVRADLADDLDVHRLFTESTSAFGGVDVIVHTTKDNASVLYAHAARHVRRGGTIVATTAAEVITPPVASKLRTSGITVGRFPPEAALTFLDRWRQQTPG